jgi:trehalose 6-phosphate synthase/phosphatase
VYGSLHFQPVHHYHQRIDRDEYFALLSVADLAIVTSIRDGMNTTSMEYVLCQAETKNPLILSEYCGIATSMRSAVRINPWDLSDCARAIDHCLTMSEDEKATRHAELHKRVTTHTAAVWSNDLVLKLLESLLNEHSSHHTPPLVVKDFIDRFTQARKRLLLFDYDGTLTPIVKTPSAATPTPQLLKALATLCDDPRNIVYVISGRDCAFLDQHLGHIKALGFSAEHGCFLKAPNETEWKDLTEGIDMSWRADVEDVFRCAFARQIPNLADHAARLFGADDGLLRREEREGHHVPSPQRRPDVGRVPGEGVPGHPGKHAGAPRHRRYGGQAQLGS